MKYVLLYIHDNVEMVGIVINLDRCVKIAFCLNGSLSCQFKFAIQKRYTGLLYIVTTNIIKPFRFYLPNPIINKR